MTLTINGVTLERWRDVRRGAPLFYHGPSDEWYRVMDRADAEASPCIGRANMDAFEAKLRAIEQRHRDEGVTHEACDLEDETETIGCYTRESFGGAFGRGEWLFVNPACDEAVAAAVNTLRKLADYPVIDEELWSEYELEEQLDSAAEALQQAGLALGDEARDAAHYVYRYADEHHHGWLYSYDDEPPPETEEWWPGPRSVFWGYVAYRRSERQREAATA